MISSNNTIRYERHLDLKEVGFTGQEKLLNSKVLIVGAGGLGCPIALYLCAAGIGSITIADDDCVSLSNLQRQILYGTSDINLSKVLTAKQKLGTINEFCNVNALNMRIDHDNVNDIVQKHDIVVDGSDNFKTRYLLNECCHKNKKPLVSGSILRFDGQISVFKSYESNGPCYSCLYPHVPQPHEVPSCVESAVISPLPGIIGTLCSMEVIKELLVVGTSLSGFILMYDGLSSEIKKIKINKKTNCVVCSYDKNYCSDSIKSGKKISDNYVCGYS